MGWCQGNTPAGVTVSIVNITARVITHEFVTASSSTAGRQRERATQKAAKVHKRMMKLFAAAVMHPENNIGYFNLIPTALWFVVTRSLA